MTVIYDLNELFSIDPAAITYLMSGDVQITIKSGGVVEMTEEEERRLFSLLNIGVL